MAEPSDKVTGFFSLPRELRDIIYDMAREEYSRAVNGVWFRYRAAIPTLRLVSRQLKLEYDQRPAVNTSVHVFDMLNRCTVEHFPRLAINSRYLELAWTCEVLYTLENFQSFSDFEPSLESRLSSLQRLVSHLPEVKEVHIVVVEPETRNLKSMAEHLSACPVLTSFSIKSAGFLTLYEDPVSGISDPSDLEWVPWSRLQESVDLAIWSREHGFLVDNTNVEKAEQEATNARERHARRVKAEHQSSKVVNRAPDALDEGGLDNFAGQATS